MADLKVNIRQAISDFDDIKAALEENGIPVPYDTDTSEYGNLVRKLGTEVSHEIIGYIDEELAKKVDKAEGERLITDEEAEVIANVKGGGFENLIEIVKVAGETQPIVDKAVNIPIAGENYGVVKSATGDNLVSILADGTMRVGVINLNTLVQNDEDELILVGGSAF